VLSKCHNTTANLKRNTDSTAAMAAKKLQRWEKTTPWTPPCGKICSYGWDVKKHGKYYPSLYKAVNCSNTLYRMAHSPYPVIQPPPRRPPRDLLNNFTIHGLCPVSNMLQYFDQSNGNIIKKLHYNATAFRKLLELDHVTNINVYRDNYVFKHALHKYQHLIHEKRVAVVGTQKPWAEAMLLNLGAKSVTTIEYRALVVDDERVTTITPYSLAKQFISGQAVPFDTVLTFSSLEHSGLGRYGDPISPFGDLEATAQVWCMVKPGGHFILAVPTFKDRKKCLLVWNAHRIYGFVRLQHLTANWHVLDEIESYQKKRLQSHSTFVLQKVEFGQSWLE